MSTTFSVDLLFRSKGVEKISGATRSAQKLETAAKAVINGVEAAVILDGRKPHALLVELFTDHGAGTLIS